MIIEMLLFKHQ